MKIFRKNIFRLIVLLVIAALAIGIYFLYRYNIISHRKFSNEHFGITNIVSSVDKDGDGVDDQTDILESAKAYVATNPEYKSKYYNGGYPDDEYGVCTDVVAFAMKDAGYDLMALTDKDIRQNPDDYNIDDPDANIDFRRVRNLEVYFRNNAVSLTTDIYEIDKWHGGDIVIFPEHIGIVSDVRNSDGMPFVIHHAWAGQPNYEEDILGNREVIGHYRISE